LLVGRAEEKKRGKTSALEKEVGKLTGKQKANWDYNRPRGKREEGEECAKEGRRGEEKTGGGRGKKKMSPQGSESARDASRSGEKSADGGKGGRGEW